MGRNYCWSVDISRGVRLEVPLMISFIVSCLKQLSYSFCNLRLLSTANAGTFLPPFFAFWMCSQTSTLFVLRFGALMGLQSWPPCLIRTHTKARKSQQLWPPQPASVTHWPALAQQTHAKESFTKAHKTDNMKSSATLWTHDTYVRLHHSLRDLKPNWTKTFKHHYFLGCKKKKERIYIQTVLQPN